MRMFAYELEEAPSCESWGLGLSEYGAVLSDMDDLWTSLDRRPDKFELLDLPLGDFILEDAVLDTILDWTIDSMDVDNNKIVHHDCMWAGMCSDEYHPGNGPTSSPPPLAAPVPPIISVMSPAPLMAPSPAQNTAGRSLLLSAARAPQRPSRTPRKPAQASPKRPDTPQSLDEDEHPQFRHTIDLANFVSPTRVSYRTPAPVTIDRYDFDDEQNDGEDSENEGTYIEYTHPAFDVRDSRTYRENTIASDHSYTLCKTSKQAHLDNLGVQTPSDSEEEEIDVESLGEKMGPGARGPAALPTNPSALDRHQLQRTVASAMGARNPQPPRVGRPACSSRPRKRPRDRSPPTQQSRYRKRKKLTADPRRSPSDRRTISSPNSDSEAENIEKRSLHNDMERQRRIGLKNLFDELKREVPSIREKERAPKVVVLREAAALCLKLQREDREREQLRARQARLLARVRHLRLDLAARRPNA